MGKHIHLFNTQSEFEEAYNGNKYIEPWVSYTEENEAVNYNKYASPEMKVPLTFVVESAGNIIWRKETDNVTLECVIEYCKNGGEWTPITANTTAGTSISVVAGDTVQFRGDNPTYYQSSVYCGDSFKNSTAGFRLVGNIMSMIDKKNFPYMDSLEFDHNFYRFFYECTGLTDASGLLLPAMDLSESCYCYLFGNCTSLTAIPELPATGLSRSCYESIFRGCTSLAVVPTNLLQATTLAAQCYCNMFNGCSNLTVAPVLPAMTATSSCYSDMFQGCTSLTTAPALPATSIYNFCYNGMFQGCTALVNGPTILPATTLYPTCYGGMFSGCTNLETAPEMPAETLVNACYRFMFQGCSKLNYIKCLATDISASNCVNNWVSGVQTTSGMFVKNANMSGWPSGVSGIPANWTTVNA